MNEQAQSNFDSDEDQISMLDFAIALGEEKNTVFLTTVISIALSLVAILLMTPMFTAKVVLLPPQTQQNGVLSALANIGGIGSIASVAAGVKSPEEQYIAIMQSEGVQNAIVNNLDLKERYQTKTMIDARSILKDMVRISSDKKTGLITIEADDRDPEFAALLAETQLIEFRVLMGKLAITDAQQRRKYYEQQIVKTQEDLARSEADFNDAKAKSGMQITTIVADGGVRASTEIRNQIAVKEVQLASMANFSTPINPDVRKIASELEALRKQLKILEQGGGVNEKKSLTENLAVKSYREIKAREAMMTFLVSQLESARIDESREGPSIQVVDIAHVPERKSKPKGSIILALSALSGLFVGVVVAFIRINIRKAKEKPETLLKMKRCRAVWSIYKV